MTEKAVQCRGCDRFQRSTAESAVGTCGLDGLEHVDFTERYCTDWSNSKQYLQKYPKPKRAAAAGLGTAMRDGQVSAKRAAGEYGLHRRM